MSERGPEAADPIRTYTMAELAQLTANLRALLTRVHGGEFSAGMPNLPLLRELHAAIFSGVRAHAGRIRHRAEGSEHLTFGPHRSVHRDQVPGELETVFNRLTTSVRSLDDNRELAEYEPSAIRTAVWVHAEVIRVHPFEDGNGRSSRALLTDLPPAG